MCLPTLVEGRARLEKSDLDAQALVQHREEEEVRCVGPSTVTKRVPM